VDRYHFYADPGSGSDFLPKVLHMMETQICLVLFFTAVPAYICWFFLVSVIDVTNHIFNIFDSFPILWTVFQYFGKYFEIFWSKGYGHGQWMDMDMDPDQNQLKLFFFQFLLIKKPGSGPGSIFTNMPAFGSGFKEYGLETPALTR
jgi:hypothetical protein